MGVYPRPSWLSRLHYMSLVPFILSISTILFVTRLIFGGINCEAVTGMTKEQVTLYCLSKNKTFDTVADTDGKVIQYSRYYITMPFVLFFEGLIICIPGAIWQLCCGKLIQHLIEEANIRTAVRTMLIKGENFGWYINFITIEVLNFVVTLTLAQLTDHFLLEQFMNYGTVFYEGRSSELFPDKTNCTVTDPNDDLSTFTSSCKMPLNQIHSWVIAAVWLAYMVVISLNILILFYRVLQVFLIRFKIYSKWFGPSCHMSKWVTNLRVYDWLFLCYLERSMNSMDAEGLYRYMSRAPNVYQINHVRPIPTHPRFSTLLEDDTCDDQIPSLSSASLSLHGSPHGSDPFEPLSTALNTPSGTRRTYTPSTTPPQTQTSTPLSATQPPSAIFPQGTDDGRLTFHSSTDENEYLPTQGE